MILKKFAKLFVLFTMMNLLGTVVWAAENQPSCEAGTDLVVAKSLADDTAAPSPAQSGSSSTAVH